MRRLLLATVLALLTTASSAAYNLQTAIRPLVYGGEAKCTVWQVEELPEFWVTAGHCYLKGQWVEIFPGVSKWVELGNPTIDGHAAIWMHATHSPVDIGILRTPGYDVPGLEVANRDPKPNQDVEFAGYRKAEHWDQTWGKVKHAEILVPFPGGPRVTFTVDRLKLDAKHLGPTFGSSGSPVLDKAGKVVGVMIGSIVPISEDDEGQLLPADFALGDIVNTKVTDLLDVIR